MQKKILKEIKQRKLVSKKEKINKILKYFLLKSNTLKKDINFFKKQQWLLNTISYSKIKINNRCLITNRSKSNFNKFKMSRIILRNLISNGKLPGIYKYFW